MPSIRIMCAALLAVLAIAPQSARADTSLTSPAVRAAIDRVVAEARKTYGGRTPVPAVLVGVWNASGSYVQPYGDADLATHRALTTADHFRIGSNTKTFVISVLLQLIDEGRLHLDDPISRFSLGVTIPNGNHITVREMCEMRSGLFEAYDTPQILKLLADGKLTGSSIFDVRTMVRWAMEQKPHFAPGTGYNYSNTNYLILGLLIESITHDTVAHQIETRLIDRFGLRNTSYPATQAMPSPWAHGYALDKNKQWTDVSGTVPVSLMDSAGEMISGLRDMTRWVTLYVTGKTSAPATHRALLRCLPTGQGNIAFGLGIACTGGYYGYTGGLPGYNTANYYLPSTGTTIVAWVIARIVAPNNVPFLIDPGSPTKSGL